MHDSRLSLVRHLLIVGVLVVLPLLAVPPINRRVNDWIHPAAASPDFEVDGDDGRSRDSQPDQAKRATLSIEEELRLLGAEDVHFSIDPTSPFSYTCRCRLAIPNSSVYSRAFAAEGSSPAQAMEQLLDKVRQWRAAAGP